jgi:staphylococcal nuclease domain-containing protein 1
MCDFSAHYKGTTPSPGFAPKAGNLVSAKISDGASCRAKIRYVSTVKLEAEVNFIDYGNQDTIGFKDIRPLDPKSDQAHNTCLRCAACPVHLTPPTELYHSRY